jgi:hypothetical protein
VTTLALMFVVRDLRLAGMTRILIDPEPMLRDTIGQVLAEESSEVLQATEGKERSPSGFQPLPCADTPKERQGQRFLYSGFCS